MARRSLSDGEIALARSIFGNSIDYETVRVFDRGYALLRPLGNMSFRGNIYLPHGYEPDFSRAALPAQRLFIHELTHVWQHQNGVLNLLLEAVREAVKHRLRYRLAYQFLLEAGRDLVQYGVEQQAAIIEHHFLRLRGAPSMGRCLNTDADMPALLAGVLARFLEDPAYARRNVDHNAASHVRHAPSVEAIIA